MNTNALTELNNEELVKLVGLSSSIQKGENFLELLNTSAGSIKITVELLSCTTADRYHDFILDTFQQKNFDKSISLIASTVKSDVSDLKQYRSKLISDLYNQYLIKP